VIDCSLSLFQILKKKEKASTEKNRFKKWFRFKPPAAAVLLLLV
jgi:hypothetical protein